MAKACCEAFNFESTHATHGTPLIAVLVPYLRASGDFADTPIPELLKWLVADSGAQLYAIAPPSSEPIVITLGQGAYTYERSSTCLVGTAGRSFVSVLLQLCQELSILAGENKVWCVYRDRAKRLCDELRLTDELGMGTLQIPEEVVDMWLRLADSAKTDGDLDIAVQGGEFVRVHSFILMHASPALANLLQDRHVRRGHEMSRSGCQDPEDRVSERRRRLRNSAGLIAVPVTNMEIGMSRSVVAFVVRLVYTGCLPESGLPESHILHDAYWLCISWQLHRIAMQLKRLLIDVHPQDAAGVTNVKWADRVDAPTARLTHHAPRPRPPNTQGGRGRRPRPVGSARSHNCKSQKPTQKAHPTRCPCNVFPVDYVKQDRDSDGNGGEVKAHEYLQHDRLSDWTFRSAPPHQHHRRQPESSTKETLSHRDATWHPPGAPCVPCTSTHRLACAAGGT
eukprot:TRINITY_DN104678_c0_g1_i1.p1 TRINITY_DN104678_c0_g1~~TRINITY_DN104678_c0_g1_i1.p1  ORF type:complete len:501 (+),score=53.43 TRINITY_DN104678_c0_g1_i1:149-1504(+)